MKTVVVGVCGGIAAYKACEIVSSLKKHGINVIVVMTKNATEFVSPLTFETLSKNKVAVDMFDKNRGFEVEHISIASIADLFVVVPATANFIAKAANGISDDMLTTTFLATKATRVVCPSMNNNMYDNIATTENIERLKERNIKIYEPISGNLACGTVGKGKLDDPKNIVSYILKNLEEKLDLNGKTITITAGATIEDIDNVRFLSNYSSGKMGIALAKRAKERGAKVNLICGRISVPVPSIDKLIFVKSTEEMKTKVFEVFEETDIFIKAAAPCDYKIKERFDNKIKSSKLILEFEKNPDIAKELGLKKGDKKLVVFCAETSDLIENAKKKLESKNADLIVANDVTKEGAGFNSDTNIVTILGKDGKVRNTDKLPKDEIADIILDEILKLES